MKYYIHDFGFSKRTPQEQGKQAELALLKKFAVYHDWFVLTDVLIPTDDGTAQIDYLIITPRCIFVVELKTFHGLIVGHGDSQFWKHYNKKYLNEYYYNPIFQNMQHVNHLHRFLKDIPFPMHYHSMIFMWEMENAKLKIYPPYPPDTSIVSNFSAFMRLIQFVCEKKKMDLTMEESQLLFDYIRLHQIHGQEARENHIKYASSFQKNNPSVAEICPKCQAKLIVKHGKYGAFLGCSNYPKCRYTQNLK